MLRIQEKARDILHWPGINAELANIVNNSDTCQEYQNQQEDEYQWHMIFLPLDVLKLIPICLSLKISRTLLLLNKLQIILVFVYFQINDLLSSLSKISKLQVWNP